MAEKQLTISSFYAFYITNLTAGFGSLNKMFLTGIICNHGFLSLKKNIFYDTN